MKTQVFVTPFSFHRGTSADKVIVGMRNLIARHQKEIALYEKYGFVDPINGKIDKEQLCASETYIIDDTNHYADYNLGYIKTIFIFK